MIKKLSTISQVFPVCLLVMYVVFYLFTEMDWYYDLYDKVVVKIDSVLLSISLIGAFFFIKRWKILPIVSLSTVIVLNILTEVSFRVEITKYYEIYFSIIVLALLLMLILTTIKKQEKM